MIVLITVHGIGFQQPPSLDGKVRGYADQLHENLRRELRADLGDEPIRIDHGQSGPVYVQSNWPPFTGPAEEGLRHLGDWGNDVAHLHINENATPALASAGRIADVALAYSGLEEQEWDPVGHVLNSEGPLGRGPSVQRAFGIHLVLYGRQLRP